MIAIRGLFSTTLHEENQTSHSRRQSIQIRKSVIVSAATFVFLKTVCPFFGLVLSLIFFWKNKSKSVFFCPFFSKVYHCLQCITRQRWQIECDHARVLTDIECIRTQSGRLGSGEVVRLRTWRWRVQYQYGDLPVVRFTRCCQKWHFFPYITQRILKFAKNSWKLLYISYGKKKWKYHLSRGWMPYS